VTPALAGPLTFVAVVLDERDGSRKSSKLRQRDTVRIYEGKPTVGN